MPARRGQKESVWQMAAEFRVSSGHPYRFPAGRCQPGGTKGRGMTGGRGRRGRLHTEMCRAPDTSAAAKNTIPAHIAVKRSSAQVTPLPPYSSSDSVSYPCILHIARQTEWEQLFLTSSAREREDPPEKTGAGVPLPAFRVNSKCGTAACHGHRRTQQRYSTRRKYPSLSYNARLRDRRGVQRACQRTDPPPVPWMRPTTHPGAQTRRISAFLPNGSDR